MAIISSEPLTLAEVRNLLGDSEQEQETKRFIGQFDKTRVGDARKLKDEIKGLDIIKLKDEHIAKIIDFKPQDASDLNKILPDVSLDQEEINKILNVIKK